MSVIIPTYQRPDDLARCLDQLAPGAQTLPFDRYEVIVTDDEGEGSETEQLVKEKYTWARWVPAPGRGPAANRNNGARHANGKWLVFTDDDCIPQPQWLGAYLDAIRSNPSDILEGATHPEGPRPHPAAVAPINKNGGHLWSCNLAVQKESFGQLNGFSESYPFALEDMDFHVRATKSGLFSSFVTEAIVVHPWRSIDSVFQDFKTRLKGWRTFKKKHPDRVADFNWGWVLGPIIDLPSKLSENYCRSLGDAIWIVNNSLLETAIRIIVKI